MPRTLNIPEGYKNSFFRLINLVPEPFNKEEQIQRDILQFLKLEGEEFVRSKIVQSYEIFKAKTKNGSVAVKREK